ncbi:hypothetical protein ACROYT_G035093 [Oculina patagonica]
MNIELTFRLATPSDFDEILKLSEGIYDGLDYLPFRYHKWMNMDNLAVMLAYCGEKLVGLIACSIVDQGRTALSRAARTLAEFRGRGVYKQLSQAMNDFIRKQYPSVCRERFAVTGLKSLPAETKFVQLEMLKCYAKKKTFLSRHFSTTNNSIQIEACTKEYLCDVIFSSPVAQKLFSDSFILLELFPVEPVRSNIDYLQQEIDLYFAVEKCSNGAFPRSVSFGVLSPRVKCTIWSVSVYTSDPVLYEAHLLYQLKRACEVIKGDFILYLFQDDCLKNYGKRVLEELLRVELDEELSKMSVKVYENNFLP